MRSVVAIVAVGLVVLVGTAACSSDGELPPPPKTSPLSSSQLESLYGEMVAAERDRLLATFPEAEVPEVERVRFVELEEQGTSLAECLTAEGFPAEVRKDGGVQYQEIPDSQAQAQGIASYACRVKYPVNPRYGLPLTDEQFHYLYEYSRLVLTPCIEDFGHDVPSLPSEQAFREEFLTGDSWYAFEYVPYEEAVYWPVREACPPMPEQLWG